MQVISKSMKFITVAISIIYLLFLTGCQALKYRKVDAQEFPPDPKERIKKNMEEGRGFRIMGGDNKGTTYSFATSNPLWRATLDSLDFMPLVSANYSGGIVVTDWYSENNTPEESIKISIRFLSNEIRSDALKITVFSKECEKLINCKVSKSNPRIENELQVAILKRATKYKKEMIESNPKRDLDSIITSQDRK